MRQLQDILISGSRFLLVILFFLSFSTVAVHAQCNPVQGQISGNVFLDGNNNGANDDAAINTNINDLGAVSAVLVNAYDANGNLVDHAVTDILGNYVLDDLTDGIPYRIEFRHSSEIFSAPLGEDQFSNVRMVSSPSCEIDYGVQTLSIIYGDNPNVVVTCFAQEHANTTGDMETIVSIEHNFDNQSIVNKIATKAETGSVWGLAYKSNTQELFSSSFVKQNAALLLDENSNPKHDAIYVTSMNGTPTTTEFTRLSNLGINVTPLSISDVNDCAYGSQVGRTGLGAIALSENQKDLYVINIEGKSIVKIDTDNPIETTTEEIPIIVDANLNGVSYYPFALKYYKNNLYVGVTVTGEESNSANNSRVVVLKYDIVNNSFETIFSTNYSLGYWTDLLDPNNEFSSYAVQHWLTDIDFDSDDFMILGISDRKGHRYCKGTNSRLDDQHADILAVHLNDQGEWTLENGGYAGSKEGSGVGVGYGPGGGEFFGDDYFPGDSSYHYEVSLGSILVVPGKSEVISAVFDPLYNTYSGGLHRYSTTDGNIIGAKELYKNNPSTLFGKATGFGDIELISPATSLEIGNHVWIDENENGIQDPGEEVLGNMILSLYDEDCQKVGETIPNGDGEFAFNSSNVDLDQDGQFDGLRPNSSYYIVMNGPNFDKSIGALDKDGYYFVPTTQNEGSTTYPDGNDSDISIANGICAEIDGYPTIALATNSNGENNHTYDIGLKEPGYFDLALKKEIVNDVPVRVGDLVNYKITIYNQGELGAKDIKVADFIPEGLRFEAAENPNWDLEGNTATQVISTLQAGQQTELFIQLYIKAGFFYDDFINYAEIIEANDQFGLPGQDIDSTPDDDFTNDVGGVPFQTTDNQVDDSGSIDEDDHDPAAVKVFDLALTKKLVNVQSTYLPGDQVEYEIKVFNQGNVDAENITIVDYVPEGNSMATADGWFVKGDNYAYTIDELKVGEEVVINAKTTISNNTSNIGTVNYAEIAEAYYDGGQNAPDYDSVPNEDVSDDKGGEPNGPTDNQKDDSSGIDEDDHDPATFSLSNYDLALFKTTTSNYVKPGEVVSFDITILNQGNITASEIEVIDYLPENLEYVESPGWEFDGENATCLLSVENGLLPAYGLVGGQETSISIQALVLDDGQVGKIINVAEIAGSKDLNGIDRTYDDTDSYSDRIPDNDIGGEVFGPTDNMVTDKGNIDEDDQDPAALQVILGFVENECVCLSNATTTETGQFVNTFYLLTDTPDENWQISSVNGLEKGLNDLSAGADINAYTIGDQVVTTPFVLMDDSLQVTEEIPGLAYRYAFEGISLDGESFSVTVTNGSESFTFEGGACNYTEQIIEGASGVCASSVTSYCVPENIFSEYEWTLSGGGTIISPVNEACVEIEWDATAGGPFTLSVEQLNQGLCADVGEKEIQVGIAGGALACIAHANISLNSNCMLEVTPALALQNEITPENVYDVIVMDPQGNMLPEPIIDGQYIGQEMTVKVVDVCSGNSCWTTITVFDKMKPKFDAQDITITCNEMVNQPYPVATDNCDPAPVVELISEDFNTLTCDPNFTTEVTRVFQATDNQGNVSDPFTQTIFLERLDVSAIEFPEARTVQNGNPVFCQQYDLDDNGNPAPSTTGFPTYNGQAIFPYEDQYCSFGIDYEDEIIAPNGCVTKVMRTWTAFEWWCSTAIVETFVQEINIADQLNPQFAAPSNITVSTNTAQCFATVDLPAVSPVDDCSSDFEVDIQYPDGFINNSNGATVDLELGENLITYTVYDGCLNSSSQTMTVTVVDNTPPVMICDQNSVVSLKADGTAYVYAESFDDGTIEDCTPLTFEVRRMDNGSACNLSNLTFGPFVEFCCADAGQSVQILLRATDGNNNTNTCMVNILVQDKNPPVITVPADLTIECTDPFDENNLGATFGNATANDNCVEPIITESSSININDCNTGNIVRTFTATDGNGQDVGTQIITVINSSVFSESDIEWPQDYTTDESCNASGLQPDDLDPPFDYPVLSPDACDMIDLGFQDQQFTTSDDACFKIIRTWMVMDMCNLQSDGSPTMFMHDQTIVVENNIAPVIITACDSISSSLNADCDEGDITLGAQATDDCTDAANMQNTYFIDLFQDGSFDEVVSGLGGTISVSGTYPLGTHRIVYEFEDRCGNSVNCTQIFTIFNELEPIAYCQDLAVELTPMDTDGDNIVDAEMAFLPVDLVGGNSESACGTPVTLSYNVEGDSVVTVFDCFDLGMNIVTVYVTDNISGIQSSCTANVIVQDNNDVDICPTPEDCIIWPDTNLVVDFCVSDLNPATILSETIVSEPCVCSDYDITFIDSDISNPSDACATIIRNWTVTFNCFSAPLEYTFEQKITQFNASAPVITSCPDNVSGMAMDATCLAPVTIDLPTFDSSCSFGVTITNDSPFADSNTGNASGDYPVGNTVVTYTITDACGNASTCSLEVEVNDTGAPTCATQDMTVSIPSTGGFITIADDAVDNNSQDDCGTIVSYSTTPNTFTCDNLGDNVVTMTVTDNSGNTSSCVATVTVVDEVAPICNAGNLTITLFSDIEVTITGEQLNDDSIDTCGNIVSFEAVPNTFSCADAGINDVVLIVTDDNGNTSSCMGTVEIVDGVDPICASQDISIILDGDGNYTLDPSEIDNGSADVCGTTVNLSVDPSTFTCDDLGENEVILTVTDAAGNSSTCTSTVTVTDTIAPICNAGTANITLFSATSVTVPATFVDNGSIDECGTIVSRTITPNTFGCEDIGMNSVILTVTDENGNSSQCEGFVNVMDNVAPTAIAMDITVTIESSGIVVIEGLDVDDGSFDDCGEIVNYMVTPDTFDCTELGVNLVELKVTDNSGNTATATANVTVESMDTLICMAQDLTVYLDENGEVTITPEDVDNGSMAPCGSTITLSLDRETFFCNDAQQNPTEVLLTITDDITGEMDTCAADITVLDTIPPTVVCPADMTFSCEDDLSDPAIFGIVQFLDNCPGALMMDTIVVEDLNECGVGTIERTYIAQDLSGNQDSCTQLITIEITDGDAFSEANIIWPDTILMVDDCSSILPEDLNSFPTIDEDGLTCFNVSIDYEDTSSGMSSMCIDTILRLWTVIDSCQLESGNGTFTFEQTIFLDDSDAPIIQGLPTDTTLFVGQDSCTLFVDLSAAFAEDCTMTLIEANDSPFSFDQGSLDASGIYPLGTTTVSLTAEDACGNIDTFMINVTIQDTIIPIVDCIKVFTDITDDGTATVFPNQFVNAMSDNCTDSVNMQVSFILDFAEGDMDPSDNEQPDSLTFTCDDLGVSVVFLIFYDESGNFTFCGAQIAVEDPLNICSGVPTNNLVNGNVYTQSGEPVQETEVYYFGSSNKQTNVDQSGNYAFTDLPNYATVFIEPYNNTNMLQGVTTLDVLMIQNHIMGTSKLPTAYDMIAADVNHSEEINGTDIINLQKVILGDLKEFPNNTSFRFIDENYVFLDEEMPFLSELPEKVLIEGINGPVSQNFVGIKIGDVNNSYQGLKGNEKEDHIEHRSVHTLSLNNRALESKNGIVEIPVYSNQFYDLQALQMSIASENNEIVSIAPGLIDLTSNDFRINETGNKLMISWVNTLPIEVQLGDVLFTLRVRSQNSLVPGDVISLTNELNEFYGADYNIADLRIRSEELHYNNSAEMFQNSPNPWTNSTIVSFELMYDDDYVLNFFDIDGRLIHKVSGFAPKGINQVKIDRSDLGSGNGVIIYELTSNNRKFVKRMMLIE